MVQAQKNGAEVWLSQLHAAAPVPGEEGTEAQTLTASTARPVLRARGDHLVLV